MSGVDDGKFATVLTMVKRAKTDNEKFAAMLIITKAINAVTLSEEKLSLLLDCIGLQFPMRLLATACKVTADQETSKAYSSIAVSVIKLFCMSHLKCHWEVTVPMLLKTIETFSDCHGFRDVIDDCLDAVMSLLNQEIDINYGAVFNVLTSFPYPWPDKLISVLTLVIQSSPELTRSSEFEKWLNNISTQFKTANDSSKFDICEYIGLVFQNLHDKGLPNSEEWLSNVITGLNDILCSKVTHGQRKSSLVLASHVLSLYGLSSFVNKSREKNFIVIVVRLACIEIGIFFRDVMSQSCKHSRDEEDLSLTVSCFKITELFCQEIALFEQNESGVAVDSLSFEQISLAQPSLADMTGSVMDYISLAIEKHPELKQNESQMLHSSIRVFGSWMNIEYNVSSAQGVQALSIIPKLLDYVWGIRDYYLMKFLFPAIMLSTETDNTSAATTDQIFTSVCNMLNDLLKVEEAFIHLSEEQINLHLALQCMISMCQLQLRISDQNAEHISSLLCIMSDSIDVHKLHLVTEAYICTLVTICLNLFPSIRKGSNNLFKRCLDFLFGAYVVSKTTHKLEMTDKYQSHWTEVSPLWQSAVRETVKYCDMCNEGRNLYQNSGWPTTVREISSKAEGLEHFAGLADLLSLS